MSILDNTESGSQKLVHSGGGRVPMGITALIRTAIFQIFLFNLCRPRNFLLFSVILFPRE